MNETQLKTVAQLRAFLNGTLAVEFQPIGEDSLLLRLCSKLDIAPTECLETRRP